MSTQYLLFVTLYATLLAAASLVVLTERGQSLILSVLEKLGYRTGAGPWGFLQTFGTQPPVAAVPVRRQAALAESYIMSAHEQTLVGARVALWVLISGCVACVIAAAAIVGVLPAFVVSGAWTYEAYVRASLFVVYGSAAGGLAMAVGLAVWLSRRVFDINCGEGCAAAHALVAAAQHGDVPAEFDRELATGAYPRLDRLISHVRR